VSTWKAQTWSNNTVANLCAANTCTNECYAVSGNNCAAVTQSCPSPYNTGGAPTCSGGSWNYSSCY
jgi:hypothetical protein